MSVTGWRSTVMAAVVIQTGAKAGRRKSKEFSPLVKKPQVFFSHRSAQYSNKIMISQFCPSLKICSDENNVTLPQSRPRTMRRN